MTTKCGKNKSGAMSDRMAKVLHYKRRYTGRRPIFLLWYYNIIIEYRTIVYQSMLSLSISFYLLIDFSDGSVRNPTSTQSLNFDAF